MTASLPEGYRWTSLDETRRLDVLALDTWAFPLATSPRDLLKAEFPLDWNRTIGVAAPGAAQGQLAAVYSSYEFRAFPVPGAAMPVGGLTWVGVHPAHRRRGILTAMVDRHLEECAARGETFSALFAAENAIYGRFGYGRAADELSMEIPRKAPLRDIPGASEHTVRIEQTSRQAHGDIVNRAHREAGCAPTGVEGINRPGWVGRETEKLQAQFWDDFPEFRGGRESRRIVIVERGGEPRGYARFRRTLEWHPNGAEGRVGIEEVVALDAPAARALWGVLLDFDLSTVTTVPRVPVDDAITHLLVDRRAASLRVNDNLWVRLVDVRAALAGRRYAADVNVAMRVTDTRLPANVDTWRVSARAFEEATCGRTADEPDITLDVRELAAVYLGGTALAALAAAGLVTEHTPGSLRQASAAFSWPVAPGASWIF
jgi:predicted acetyltransferase